MKANVQKLHSLVLVAFLFFGANVRGASPFIVQQPETLIAEVGTFAAFSVRATVPSDAAYQWQFNGSNIVGATQRELALPSPTVDHVGAYTVQVTWPSTNMFSSTAFLSVYELYGTNSTAGTLTTSAQQFGIPPSGTYSCPYYPSILFNKFYNPTNSSGDFYFFYGPNVPVAAQSGPFINAGHNKYIEISTAGSYNVPTFTGVRYLSSFNPPGYPPYDCGCESGNSVYTPELDFYNMSLNTSVLLARYRVTIYYTTPPPSNGRIVMNWRYFD